MISLSALNNQTKVTIHWEVIVPILCIMLFVILIRLIILLSINKQLSNYIKINNYGKALQTAEKLNKYLLTHSLFSDLNKLTIAVLYLYNDKKQDCQNYLSKITNKQLIMAKNYWETVIALLNNDSTNIAQSLFSFENSPKPTNKKLISYEKYKYNLFVIKEFCANKNDKTLKELKELVKDDNSLQSKVISKLFIQD